MYNLLMTVLMALSINADSWKSTLPVVLFGMVGIFIVIGVIVLLTYLLNKVTSKSSKKKDKNKDE